MKNKTKDTYDVGLDNLRGAIRNFLQVKIENVDAHERQITDELAALAVAVVCSISRTQYEELREEVMDEGGGSSKVKAKLSFSAELRDDVVECLCSGNIKLKNEVAVKVEDGRQLKLDL